MKMVKGIFRLINRFKYIIVVVIGIALVVFIDKNSMMKRMSYNRDIKSLQEEINKFTTEFRRDSAMVVKLKTDPQAIRNIARERYFMKQDDEDIFVLSDEVKNTQTLETE